MSLLLGILAAALAWEVNKFSGRLIGTRWIYLSPLAEESIKTAAAVLCGGDILLTHLSFGAVEGFWEYFNRRNGYYAGLAALASHSVFGFAALSAYSFYNSLPIAVGAGFLVHTAWNYLVVRYFAH